MPRVRRQAASLGLTLVALTLFAVAFAWPSGRADGEPLLVADLRGRALVVLDPARPAEARRIALPGAPHELLRLPDGRVVVSIEQSGLLAVVDTATGDVQSVEVGGLPHGLALAPDMEEPQTLLVTDRSVDAVRRFILDGPPDAWREIAPLPTDRWPHAVAVLPGGQVAVASAVPGTLTVGDHRHETGSLTESVAVAPDGRVAVAAALDGTVTVYSPGGERIGQYDVGGRPVRVAFSPDGRRLAAALSAAGAVAVIEDGAVRRSRVAGVPDGLAFSSDGRVLYASDVHGGAVTALSADAARVLAIIEVGAGTGAMLAWAAP